VSPPRSIPPPPSLLPSFRPPPPPASPRLAPLPSAGPFPRSLDSNPGFARLWRLAYHYFRKYPWLLVPIVDPASSEELVASCTADFLKLPPDSPLLDPGLGRKIRAMVTSAAQLAPGTKLHKFLHAYFLRVVMTSTFVERIFKDLTAWTGAQGQSIAMIAAKHCNVSFASSVKRWREAEEVKSCDPAGITPYTHYGCGSVFATGLQQ